MPHHTESEVVVQEPFNSQASQHSDKSSFHIPDSQNSSQTLHKTTLGTIDTNASQHGPVQPSLADNATSPMSTQDIGGPQVEEPQLSQHWQDFSSQRSETVRDLWVRPRTPVLPVNTSALHVNGYQNGQGSPTSHNSTSPTHGSKRTASGAIKVTSPPTDGSLPLGSFKVHSRHQSIGSDTNKLSSQLKTRLSYAMVKVQNGWEARSINEVESLAASAINSPVSARGPTGDSWLPQLSTDVHAAQGSRDLALKLQSQVNSRYPNSSWTPNGPTHKHRLSLDARLKSQQHASVPSLAPAPELVPNRYRRVNGQQARPALVTSHLDAKSPTAPQAYYSRATPPTDQEQDAIDTLLFMSSPANSNHFPRSTQGSPRKNGYLGHNSVNMVDRDLSITGSSEEELGHSARQAKRRSLNVLKSGGDVERMLKQMGDEEMDAEIRERQDPPVPNGVPTETRAWIRS